MGQYKASSQLAGLVCKMGCVDSGDMSGLRLVRVLACSGNDAEMQPADGRVHVRKLSCGRKAEGGPRMPKYWYTSTPVPARQMWRGGARRRRSKLTMHRYRRSAVW
jgi:hypothetical protein